MSNGVAKTSLVKALKSLVSAHKSDLLGIRASKGVLELFIFTDFLSVLQVKGFEEEITPVLVNSEAFQAAINQSNTTIYIDVKTENSSEGLMPTVVIGNAALATREPPDIQAVEDDQKLLPLSVIALVQDRFTDTFVPVNPKSVFGWELQIKDGTAYYGSANGPQAILEETSIDADDQTIRLPHKTCLNLLRITKNITDMGISKKILMVQDGDVKHYLPYDEETPSITLDTVKKLAEDCMDCESGPLPVKDKIVNLLAFADKESRVVFSVKSNLLWADISSSIGKNRVELGTFKHTDVSYSITLLQCMPFVKYTADSAVIGLGLRGKGLLDKIPFINSLFYTIVIEKKKYLHTYLTACSSR